MSSTASPQSTPTPFHPFEKVALFIDAANLNHSARALDFDIDFSKLRSFFADNCYLVRATFYTAVVEQEDGRQLARPLIDFLEFNHYSVVQKMAKTMVDEGGVTKVKGNMDIDMAVGIFEALDHVDHIVMFTGDGDFRPVVELCQRRGKRVTVVSSMISKQIADELRRQTDFYLDLNDLKPAIARTGEKGAVMKRSDRVNRAAPAR